MMYVGNVLNCSFILAYDDHERDVGQGEQLAPHLSALRHCIKMFL